MLRHASCSVYLAARYLSSWAADAWRVLSWKRFAPPFIEQLVKSAALVTDLLACFTSDLRIWWKTTSLCYSLPDLWGVILSSSSITSANLFLCLCAWAFLSALFHSHSPSFSRVGSLEPLSPFPGGHPLPSPPHHRRWTMWHSGSSAHYHPRWAYRGHGTVEHGSVFTASCQGFLSLNWGGCGSSLYMEPIQPKIKCWFAGAKGMWT